MDKKIQKKWVCKIFMIKIGEKTCTRENEIFHLKLGV